MTVISGSRVGRSAECYGEWSKELLLGVWRQRNMQMMGNTLGRSKFRAEF